MFSHNVSTPAEYDSVSALLDRAEAEDHVRAYLVVDRSYAVHVSHSKADQGARLAPVQGTNGQLRVLMPGSKSTVSSRSST